MTPILAILIGVVTTLILVAIAIVVVIRSRGIGGEDKRPKPKINNGGVDIRSQEHDKSTVPLKMSIDPDVDDKNPDVIPQSLGEYFQKILL